MTGEYAGTRVRRKPKFTEYEQKFINDSFAKRFGEIARRHQEEVDTLNATIELLKSQLVEETCPNQK